MIQKVEMSSAITVFSILNSVRFVTSTFIKTETLTISPVCDECHIVTIRIELLGEIKIVTTKKGTYRTVSSIPYDRIANLLETDNLNEKPGYLVLLVNNSVLVRAEHIKS